MVRSVSSMARLWARTTSISDKSLRRTFSARAIIAISLSVRSATSISMYQSSCSGALPGFLGNAPASRYPAVAERDLDPVIVGPASEGRLQEPELADAVGEFPHRLLVHRLPRLPRVVVEHRQVDAFSGLVDHGCTLVSGLARRIRRPTWGSAAALRASSPGAWRTLARPCTGSLRSQSPAMDVHPADIAPGARWHTGGPPKIIQPSIDPTSASERRPDGCGSVRRRIGGHNTRGWAYASRGPTSPSRPPPRARCRCSPCSPGSGMFVFLQRKAHSKRLLFVTSGSGRPTPAWRRRVFRL